MIFQEPMTSLNPVHSIENKSPNVWKFMATIWTQKPTAPKYNPRAGFAARVSIPEAEKRLSAL